MFLSIIDDDFGVGDHERYFCIQLYTSYNRFDVRLV